MVLRTVKTLWPIYGYGIARRIEQVSKGVLELNQGTITALRTAAAMDDRELVELLLAHGADPNAYLDSGGTAIGWASAELRPMTIAHGGRLDPTDDEIPEARQRRSIVRTTRIRRSLSDNMRGR